MCLEEVMKARSEFELYIKNNLHELDKIYPHTEMKICKRVCKKMVIYSM